MKGGQYHHRSAYLLSEALASTRHLPKEEQHELLQSTRHFLADKKSQYLKQLSQSDVVLQNKANEAIKQRNYQLALDCLLKMKKKDFFQVAHLYQKNIRNYQLAENYYKKAINNGSSAAMNNLGVLYEYHFKAPE